ncbi:MAG TPA: orotidine-5'-phosphate decarboxylase, partial [Blastocatellia bacterium]|nr:orotidine-5'-phosphate decarboxylase [Blastocatellia bacterium]
VTPGIRPSDGTNDDQRRVMTPEAAVAAGSDYIVVGRPIMNASDRRAAAESIVSAIASVK